MVSLSLIISVNEIDSCFQVNQRRMIALENESYSLNDILCLLLDLFKKDKTDFIPDDLLAEPWLAPTFLNLLTNYSKFSEFIGRDTYQIPLRKVFYEWIAYSNRAYQRLISGNEEEVDLEEGFC